MTTFQDQPPQSRRAARESERAAQASASGVEYNAFLEPTESDAVRERAETARPASAGRRAQRPEGEAGADLPVAAVPADPAPEPPHYATQIPSYDGPSFARTTPRPPSDAEQPYRVRDYSPEGGRRRASLPQFSASADLDYQTAAAPSDWQPPAAEVAPTVDVTPAAEVAPAPGVSTPAAAPTAQPMTRREMRALLAQQEAAEAAALVEPNAATSTSSALSSAIAEFQSLTRAEQPAASAAEAPAAPVEAEPVAETPVAPIPLIEPSADSFASLGFGQRAEQPVPTSASDDDWQTVEQFSGVPAESDTVTGTGTDENGTEESAAETQPEIVLEDPILEPEQIVDAAEPAPFPFALQPSRTQDLILVEPVSAPVSAVVEPEQEQEHPTEPEPEVEPELEVDPEPATTSLEDLFIEPQLAVVEPVAASEPEFIEPPVVRESYTPPTGHWSRQADLDDDLPFESTLSREVGASNLSTTTSALILPSIPQSDFSGILNGTGEILITGTIELPESLGTMGGDSRNFDHPDVDHMFDAFDKELVSNDSQPVRAIRAVSTHTATRGMIQANTKTHSNRLLTVAIVAVSVVIVATVGLLAVYILSTMNS